MKPLEKPHWKSLKYKSQKDVATGLYEYIRKGQTPLSLLTAYVRTGRPEKLSWVGVSSIYSDPRQTFLSSHLPLASDLEGRADHNLA